MTENQPSAPGKPRMSDLMERIRERDAKERREQQLIAPPPPRRTNWVNLVQIGVWLVVLGLVGGAFYYLTKGAEKVVAYKQEVRELCAKLNRIDRIVLKERLRLQDQYQSKSNDMNWFAFPTVDGDRMEVKPPEVPGLSDRGWIKQHNDAVLNHNRAFLDTAQALRDEQGAPPVSPGAVEKELAAAEEQFRALKKKHPGRYAPKESALRTVEEALKLHRLALKAYRNEPADEPQKPGERQRLMLYNWRKAFLAKLLARFRLDKE